MFEDWDLGSCLEYNPQDFTFDDIDSVLAVIEGERDEDNWRWLLQLKDGRYAAMQGWCDYTGWDCRSGADSRVGESLDVISLFDDIDQSEILRQVREGVEKTRRQEVGEALGLL